MGRLEAADIEDAFMRLSAAAPPGWRVELIEDGIRVTPLQNGAHAETVSAVNSQLIGRSRSDAVRLLSYTGLGLLLPGCRARNHVMPDLVVAPKGTFYSKTEWHDASGALMVGEVTSDSTVGNDRVTKIRGYARAGIPLYLLVDREAGQVVVCSGPEGDDYLMKASYKIGLTVPLPEPLGFDLETSEF